MDFRVRHFKENKHSSNSTIEFPKNLDLLSPNSLSYQRKGTLAHLESELKGLVKAQKTEHALCMGLISRLQASVYSLECRIGQNGKDTSLLPHAQLASNEGIDPSSAEDLLLLHNPPLFGHDSPDWQLHPPSNQHPLVIKETAGKESVCEVSVSKAIDGIRTQFEGKLKALANRMQLNFNIKSQFDAKNKEEERKATLAQQQKRAAEAQKKLKTQIEQDILIKLGRRIKQETQEISNKTQSSIISLKRKLMEDLERDKKTCLQQIGKAKMELEGRVKARDERIDYNPKREMQFKKKDEQLRGKLEGLANKIQETSKIIKEDIMSELKGKMELMERDFGTYKGSLDQTKSQFRKWSDKIKQQIKQISIREAETTKEGERSLREQLMAVTRTVKQQTIINNENIKSLRENIHEKMANDVTMLKDKLSVAASETKSVILALSKLQAGIFSDRQANKAVYQKISSDILDIADSLAVLVQQMKPYRP